MCLRIWQLQCLCACSHTELHLTRTLALQGAGLRLPVLLELAACKALAIVFPATQPLRPSPAGRVGPGEREGYGGPCDVTSLSLSLAR